MKEKIVYLKTKELRNNPNNPRKNDEAVDAVAKSIKKYGFRNPLIIDKNNIVWCGNTRLKASRKLMLDEVPCIVIEDLTEQQMTELALLDNKTNEIAEWDYEILSDILNECDFDDFTELDWGIEQNIEEKEVIEDGYVEPEILEPKSKLGDIYQLGRHRLMCGDGTNDDVDKLMGKELADCIVTDPPYNVNIENTQGLKIKNDNMEQEEFFKFLSNAFSQMNKNLKKGGAFYIWHASRTQKVFEEALNKCGLIVREQLIWNKNSLVLGRQDYQWKHEPCFYGWKDGANHYFIDDRTQTTVIEDKCVDFNKLKKSEAIEMLKKIFAEKVSTTIINEKKPSKDDLHPTMKPVSLIALLIKNSSKIDENILDQFGGSGTTLIACEQLNRKCYMMEFDPHYCDIIIDRWEKFTGQKAVKIN